MTAVTRLSLTDFRNYRDALIEAADGFMLLSGPNGAGKTNVLEAVSLLTPEHNRVTQEDGTERPLLNE